ncbi:glycosyltransferase family 2 protein [Halorubrum sp. AD140]|uniref:glycosyltransferase family 2 protein n=1 Tax=Halorubrum sp. AD140 TaxID=3050073 RepID=UPI002ACCE47A|nr:glycosyltransferase family 2 protein [Halorubrum sp. AD140]MDZ5812518.1 glycosyltransferase family 2 protein [Halorubrum sp. AD140]
MYREHSVAIVVPAYNERGFVGSVLEAMPAYVDRVYAVDDASTDGTWTELLTVADGDASRDEQQPSALNARTAATRQSGPVVAFRHARNRGPGGAIKTGYLAALGEGFDLIATIDGDGQMDLALLDRFLDPLIDGLADYTKGSRFERSDDVEGMPAFRRFGNTLLTQLAQAVIVDKSLTDPVNGYTAITRQALRSIDVPELYEGYGYGIDVLGRLDVNDCRVVDIPHPASYADETSSIRYHTYVPRVSYLLAATALRKPRRKHFLPGMGISGILELFRFGPPLARIADRTEGTEEGSVAHSSQDPPERNGDDSA